jgi:acetoin utilization deacetylase AcuC-like enzyme
MNQPTIGLRGAPPENAFRLPVFFSQDMVARSGSYSPSAEKPSQVVDDLALRGLPIERIAPTAATFAELCLAHDPTYVDGVLSCRRPNGFGNTSADVARSLPFTSGAMLSAAAHALSHGVAFAPCSGFHHAAFDRAHGFCTFNGLAVTALALLASGRVRRVGILDCDMHYGDGTDEILTMTKSTNRVTHATAGASFHSPSQSKAFFRWLDESIDAMVECDVVLYQAGADPHVRDPLGGFLDDAELRERDARVFEKTIRLGVPIAWNLAGGYQREPDGSIPKVLAIHAATAEECIRVASEAR